jgi:DNA polymerase-1
MNALLARARSSADKNETRTKLPDSPAQTPGTLRYETILLDTEAKLDAALASIPENALVAFDTETTSLDVRRAKLVGFSFAYDDQKAFYVPVGHHYLGAGDQVSLEAAKAAILRLLNSRIVGQNLKYDIALLRYALGIRYEEFYADTMVLAWMIDPERAVGLDKLAQFYLNHEMIAFKDTVAKGENFSSVEIEKAALYAAEDAYVTRLLFDKLLAILQTQSPDMVREYFEIEVPFINTLIDMESHGITVDVPFFEQLKSVSTDALKKLERDIYDATAREFNINSTKQLGSVLFEELGLPPVKKTKTGYSTDDATLTKLQDAHPVIAMIQEYRELFKLHTTYIEPLLKLAGDEPDHRVHTSFLQTGTATGRLSSKNPNLQNIPTRTELGRQIRQGFVAPEGFVFLGLDYSQIELRLLAHFSQDATLLEAFREDKDIHLETARKIFGDDEAHAKRNLAKSVNFGLLYGMGSRKLSETVGIPIAEAKAVIENYFKTFASVKHYFETIKADVKKEGFVETLLGRRRYFDFANANGMQLAMFDRESVNAKFQGSAADLVKLSMLEVYRRFKGRDDIRILLQIHDELVFEVKEELAQALSVEIREIMEGILPLAVPLKVNTAIAKNWKELK